MDVSRDKEVRQVLGGGVGEELAAVNRLSSPEAKLALFRSLFRGRQDVYARRFESRRTGKCGYGKRSR